MKKKIFTAFFLLAFFGIKNLYAQYDTALKQPVYRVGIFAPLYLDSVFNKNTFRYKQGIPRFIAPAVDFVQGALTALDSLQAGNDTIHASVFDTKSYIEKIPELIKNKKLDSLNLIIGSVRDEDYLQLAAFAQEKNIPLFLPHFPTYLALRQTLFWWL